MSNNPIVDRADEEGQIVGQHALSEQRLGDTRRESMSAVAIGSSAALCPQDCDLLAATEHVGASLCMMANLNHNMVAMDQPMQLPR